MAKSFSASGYAKVKNRAMGRAQANKYAELIGDKEMFDFIKSLEKTSHKGWIVKKGLQLGGKVIVDQAKRNAKAVNAGDTIIKAIKVMTVRKAKKKYLFGVKLGVDYRVTSKKRARHAHFLEFGTVGIRYTKEHSTLKGFISNKTGEMIFPRWVKPMPARPYWRPAMDSKSTEAMDTLMKQMKIAMAQFVSKNAGGAKFT